jgi:seryl-tRNA synthetase
MLDIKYIRENKEEVIENLKNKFQEHKISSLEKLISLDIEYRDTLKTANQLRNQRNILTEEVAKRKHNNLDATDVLEKVKALPEKIKQLDQILKTKKEEIDSLLLQIPNIISKQTPIGKDDSENKVVEEYGEIKSFNFKIKSHSEIAEQLNIVDFDSSRENSGKGFYYLLGDLALLNNALIRYAQDILNKKNYTFILPPLMINKKACDGVIDFSFFKDMVYKIEGEDLHLIGTSEHPLISMFMDKTIPEENLPLKLYSYTTCFRKEIGSHGLDERGLFRLHQFDKIEQVVICNKEDSEKMFEEIKNNSIEIFKGLGLPIRILEICSGDLGDMKYRQIDLEAHSPRRDAFIELGSCSNLTEAQAIGLNIKAKTKKGEKYFVHTLNNTAIATQRALVAILENFQTKDGTIKVPEVLVPYMYGKTEIKKNENFF